MNIDLAKKIGLAVSILGLIGALYAGTTSTVKTMGFIHRDDLDRMTTTGVVSKKVYDADQKSVSEKVDELKVEQRETNRILRDMSGKLNR